MIGRRRSMSKKEELSDHGNPQSPQDETIDSFGILFGKECAVYVDREGIIILKKMEELRSRFPKGDVVWGSSEEISITRDKLPELATVHTEIPSSQIVHLGKIGSILRIEKLRGAEVISIGIKDKDAIDMFARDSMALLGIPMEKRLIKEVTGWAKALLVIGVISVVSGFFGGSLSPIWGLFLVAAGIIGLKIKEHATLIMYGIILIFAGLFNFAAFGTFPVIIGVICCYWDTWSPLFGNAYGLSI
jgi:hypothetical protein